MADTEKTPEGTEEAKPGKRGFLGIVIGIVLALVLGGAGFFAVYSGLVLGPVSESDAGEENAGVTPKNLPPVAFVPLDPLVISLGPSSSHDHLRFRAELEVIPGTEADVRALVPRVMDVLNSYLRAVEPSDLENPVSLIDLRAQMLRRIKLVTGEGRVKDLLVMEFVLN
ncbi:flagellar basal body-associated protein FliL [Maritimibacter sp. HL-12]|uniref:flagellar basal body-associated FliL family protein n=1 Tax=Maritimibacter sp. HL-12 TaxID=1162418 RepID=UPI000A0F375D|nr:flagellar basal body-associated FliL family protein [Maritimibacter sp. HL-12]SMH43059.1 flagellar FliL protein [Maritimibacter sp. HL-12]